MSKSGFFDWKDGREISIAILNPKVIDTTRRIKMADIGIKLSEKDDDTKDIYEMMDRLRSVVCDYGFKISHWNEWERFKESCTEEKIFVDKLLEKYDD